MEARTYEAGVGCLQAWSGNPLGTSCKIRAGKVSTPSWIVLFFRPGICTYGRLQTMRQPDSSLSQVSGVPVTHAQRATPEWPPPRLLGIQ